MTIESIISSFFPSAAVDVVGVFSQSTTLQLFSGARPIRAKVSKNASVMTHPVEDGSVIGDHKIINPVEIELFVILSREDYRSTYAVIDEMFRSSDFLVVQTRSGTYTNMTISAMPHDEDVAMYDAIGMIIKLTEVKVVSYQEGDAASVSSPADANNTSTKNTGKQQPSTVETSQTKEDSSSILYGIYT